MAIFFSRNGFSEDIYYEVCNKTAIRSLDTAGWRIFYRTFEIPLSEFMVISLFWRIITMAYGESGEW